jgi:hypothetical protein
MFWVIRFHRAGMDMKERCTQWQVLAVVTCPPGQFGNGDIRGRREGVITPGEARTPLLIRSASQNETSQCVRCAFLPFRLGGEVPPSRLFQRFNPQCAATTWQIPGRHRCRVAREYPRHPPGRREMPQQRVLLDNSSQMRIIRITN